MVLDHAHALGELREEQPLLEAGVAAADHHDLVGPSVEGTVARRAEMDAGPDQILLAGRLGAPVRRPRRDEHGAGVVMLAGRGLHVELVVALVGDARDRHGLQRLDPVPLGLPHDAIGEVGAADAVGEPGVVVEPFGDARLPAEPLGIDDQGFEVLARRVDAGRETRGTATHDDEVVDVLHRAALQAELVRQFLVRGLGEVRTVGEDDRRDRVGAVVPFLHDARRVGIAVHVVPLVGDALVGEELLGPPAVGAPTRPVDRDRVAHVFAASP